MSRIDPLIISEKLQFLVFVGIAIEIVALTGLLHASDASGYQRFLGRVHPVFAIVLLALAGFAFLWFLLSRGWFAIFEMSHLRGLLWAAGLALVFGLVAVTADFQIVFPEGMNIPFPDSLAFYPTIAFLVEILFHVIPLALLMALLTVLFKDARHESIAWICILVVALLEPLFQIGPIGSGSQASTWAVIWVAGHIYLINLVQLLLFKRYDFVTMFSFRLFYYAIWHIAWGYFRLKILF